MTGSNRHGGVQVKHSDIALAILVAMIWGLAFVAARLALNEVPPTLMTALRFAIAALPCLFVARPNISWRLLIAISGLLFVGQFLAQAYAIAHGIPVGLLSVIVQSQALFTIALAAIVLREKPTPPQWVGIAVAMVGLLMICGTVGYDFSAGAFMVAMTCPLTFAAGNVLLRKVRDVSMFDLFSWLALLAAVPLLLLVPFTDGTGEAWQSLRDISPTGIVSLIVVGAISTSLAYWLWGRLLSLYPAAQVVPFALLVPFIGSLSSSIVFGERFGPLRLAGMLTVVAGIAIMLLMGRSRDLPRVAS